MRTLVCLITALLLPAAASASTAHCMAHAKLIAADFRAMESHAGVHPLDMSQTQLQTVLTDYLQSNSRKEKDLARQVLLSIEFSLRDGCSNLKDELEQLESYGAVAPLIFLGVAA